MEVRRHVSDVHEKINDPDSKKIFILALKTMLLNSGKHLRHLPYHHFLFVLDQASSTHGLE